MSKPEGVEAVDRAMSILACFGPDADQLSLAELARQTGFYKSTILRLAASLERFNYITRSETGRFRLGPAAWRLGTRYRQSFNLADALRPELKLLSAATKETASFYIREGDNRICLYRAEPERAIRHAITEGAKMPLDRGASGRVLLAWSGDDSKWAVAIRNQGHAVSLGERDPEVAAISVPLIAGSGRLVGALAVSGLITRFDDARQNELIAALKNTQQRLADQIPD